MDSMEYMDSMEMRGFYCTHGHGNLWKFMEIHGSPWESKNPWSLWKSMESMEIMESMESMEIHGVRGNRWNHCESMKSMEIKGVNGNP